MQGKCYHPSLAVERGERAWFLVCPDCGLSEEASPGLVMLIDHLDGMHDEAVDALLDSRAEPRASAELHQDLVAATETPSQNLETASAPHLAHLTDEQRQEVEALKRQLFPDELADELASLAALAESTGHLTPEQADRMTELRQAQSDFHLNVAAAIGRETA